MNNCRLFILKSFRFGACLLAKTRMLSDICKFYTDAYGAPLKNTAESIVGTEVVKLECD